jgi:hypothetical protein
VLLSVVVLAGVDLRTLGLAHPSHIEHVFWLSQPLKPLRLICLSYTSQENIGS